MDKWTRRCHTPCCRLQRFPSLLNPSKWKCGFQKRHFNFHFSWFLPLFVFFFFGHPEIHSILVRCVEKQTLVKFKYSPVILFWEINCSTSSWNTKFIPLLKKCGELFTCSSYLLGQKINLSPRSLIDQKIKFSPRELGKHFFSPS
jgi:hypothetical protein